MNVTVVGSFTLDSNNRLLSTDEKFQQACEAIGCQLAKSGHRLIVPHPENETTAEHHALNGFRQVNADGFYRCTDHEGDPVLKAHFDAVEKSDAVILIGGKNGTYASGLGALRRRKHIIPIPAFGGSAKDLCEIPDIDNMLEDRIRNLDVHSPKWIERLKRLVSESLDAFPQILIIHGRGDDGRALQKKINSESKSLDLQGIASPVIMDLSGRGAISVPDEFERLASEVSAAIAIVTADDVGGFARLAQEKDVSARKLALMPRARENVWVEVGWFWGRLGRERVFLWLKDKIDLPSDLQGAAWTNEAELDDAWESIQGFVKRLRRRDPVAEEVRGDLKIDQAAVIPPPTQTEVLHKAQKQSKKK